MIRNKTKHKIAKRKKIKFEEATRNANKLIIREKNKKGINRTEEQKAAIRNNKYVKDENRERMKKNERLTSGTRGTKKEYKHTYPAKSQWKWDREKAEKEGKVKPEIQEIKEYAKRIENGETYKVKEYIILYNEETNTIKNYFTEVIKPAKDYEFPAKLREFSDDISPVKEMWIKKYDMRKRISDKVKTDYGEITWEEIIKASLKSGVDIYEETYEMEI